VGSEFVTQWPKIEPPINTTTAPMIELNRLNIPTADTAIMKKSVRSMPM